MGSDLHKILLSPAAAFIIVLGAALCVSWLFSRLSFRPGKHFKGEREPYACGESGYNEAARPDYSTFFPFAFFFTIAHVAALMMATVPLSVPAVALAALFICGAMTGLYILMRS